MRKSQEERIKDELEKAAGGWINGRFFLHTMMISQYHRAIHNLQKAGHKIEASDFKDDYGFKSYRLKGGAQQSSMFDMSRRY